MTHENFCHWLSGITEISPDTPPSKEGWKLIAAKLVAVLRQDDEHLIVERKEARHEP